MRRSFAYRAALPIASLASLSGCHASSHRDAPPEAHPLPGLVAGANVRPVGDRRRGYGTPKARETLERLRGLGVNTIAVLMEGRVANVDDVNVRLPDSEAIEDVRAALLDAHRMGFATVLIPHLYLDDGGWRGQIALKDPQRRDAWWASYGAFIAAAAVLAGETGTSLLSIGVELKAMSAQVDTRTRMKMLRDQIRKVYRGPITYSANWDEAENVVFWDLVDIVGVNGYYPLVPDPVRGAESTARRLTALHKQTGRDVLILEVGYRAGPMSHVRPWEWPEDVSVTQVDAGAQARAWAAILSNWLGTRGVRGLMIWVIPTDPDDPASEPAHGFNPLNRTAEEVLRRAFTGAEPAAG